MQCNLAVTYEKLGRHEEALQMKQDVYSGRMELYGEEHGETVRDAFNYAVSLVRLKRFEEARSLLRRTLPIVQRVARDSSEVSIRMKTLYAQSLYHDAAATLDDLRQAVMTIEDTIQIARRVFGGAHPTTEEMEVALRDAQKVLHAREA